VTGSGLLIDTPLRVAPSLLGAPLAPRWRRAAALVIDLAIIVLPSVLVGFGAAWLSLRAQDPAATRAVREFVNAPDKAARSRASQRLLPLLVRADAEGLPAAARLAIEEGRLEEAERLLGDHDIHVTFSFTDHPEPLQPKQVRLDLRRLVPKSLRALSALGVAGLYFTLFTASSRGTTPGKRLLGIRVASLGGGRVTLFESLERFGGYFHVGGTIGIGLVDLWHEPNRRLAHDRIAGTVVIRDVPAAVQGVVTAEPPVPGPASEQAPDVGPVAPAEGARPAASQSGAASSDPAESK
jgi:hypothetical protein